MNRRSGLGRGLAALIPSTPPSDDDQREAPDTGAPFDAAGRPDAEPHLDAGPGMAPPAASAPVDAEVEVVAPHPESHAPETEASAEDAESAFVAPSAATLAELDPDDIVANPRQPREVFAPEEIEGLATSLADLGMLQPVVVRPRDGGYELIAGERRLRAAKLAGLTRIPALVRHTDDADLLKEALVENIHRVQLNPLEEGAAYQQLLLEFGVTQEELATRLGRSRPAISNAIRLLQLPTPVQRQVAAGVLSAGHAKVLLAVSDQEMQVSLAERIVAEGLSVRATEELVRLRETEEPTPRRGSKRRTVTAPGLIDLQEDLSDALMARVRIAMGARRGKLSIEFTSVDDLERIVTVIADGLDEGSRPSTGAIGALASDQTLPPPSDEDL